MRFRSVVLASAIFGVLAVSACPQSNTVLDSILAHKTATFGDAAYLVMTAVGKVDDSASSDAAVTAVLNEGWGIAKASAGSPVTLGTYSFMIMKALAIPGGVMYRLSPGARYAGRELVYLGFVHGDTSPYRDISGQEAVQILGSALEYKGGR